MANTTVSGALAIHGQNPQVRAFQAYCTLFILIYEVFSRNGHSKSHIRIKLLERALLCADRYVRSSRIIYGIWFTGCTAESLIDKAIEMKYTGGVYGNQRPTEFLCLLLKLLQIQPEKEILVEYLRADEFKYPFSFLRLSWVWLICFQGIFELLRLSIYE